jgi:hypothetical protein
MNPNLRNTLIVLGLVIAAAALLYYVPRQNNGSDTNNPATVVVPPPPPPATVVTDFNSCVAAGNAVLESFPEQCLDRASAKTYLKTPTAEVVVENVAAGQLVRSPLNVKGKARGNWFFEANIPVTLKDQTGKVLTQKGFQAKGDWMTTEFVEFEGTLEFSNPATEFGTLVIAKDNPSGLEQFDKEISIPVRFR